MIKLMITILTGLLVLSAGRARAQQDNQESEIYTLRSENTALRWSVLGTLLPTITGTLIVASSAEDGDNIGTLRFAGMLFTGGLIIGPSLGYFYSNCPGRGLSGIGVRTMGLIIAAEGMAAGMGGDIYGGEDFSGGAIAMTIIGGGIFVGDMIYDFATVKKAVRDRNRKSGLSSFYIAPAYFPKHNAAGVSVNLAF